MRPVLNRSRTTLAAADTALLGARVGRFTAHRTAAIPIRIPL